ncbi:MAG: DUF1285 domain-containing protein [Rhodospirillales bacterium]|nr:DUF1285 domain-containing protein [Alphaproteobacteria bacterium]MCB1840805.1 DUF1285 domain-containing protein [Alphaproteobacteria bacterium]MCB9976169.1 DUF1285 domain-containing protein [Rhodospirillales bacterium]
MIQPQPDQDPQNFRIDSEGRWFHDGQPIAREALVVLFAHRGLKRDAQGRYWLQSPYEKYRVEVEDVPFIVTDYDISEKEFVLTTNIGEKVRVTPDNPLELRSYKGAENKIPYIHVREGLYARIGRAVYYELALKYGESVTVNGHAYKFAETLDDS